jgi:hypothetical protein
MSLATNITDLATRVATEAKALRTLINGNAADLSSLTTTAKTNLVAAINELDAAIGASGATDLDGLTDVTLTGPTTGHVLRHNGTVFVNVLGSTFFETAGAAATAQAAAIAASQPLDSDLTAIAALSTTAYGRALLTLADAAALTAAMNAATELVKGTVELATTAETVTGTDTTRAVTPAGVAAAVAALVDAAPGTLDTLNELAAALGDDPNFATTISTSLAGKQPLDTDLTAIAALVSAADRVPYATGAGTWSLATFTAAGRALLDDADAAAQRTTLSVYSQTEIGDPTTNFVTAFNAGLV